MRLVRRLLLAAASLAPLVTPTRAHAQLPAAADTMLHRLFASPAYASERFGPARWLRTGDAYTTLEPSRDGGRGTDIVAYDVATGARTVKVSAAQLRPAGSAEPLDVEGYDWSADGARLLVFTNGQRVWRQNTRGDYWVLDLRSGALRKLGGPEAEPGTLMYAKFSPDGDRVAYVRGGDVYVERLTDGRITRLTSDASRTRVNGMTDWVYEEEFDLRDGFRWAPDGHAIAYWQFDMTGVRDYLLVNDTDSLYSFVTPIQYPKAGTTNSAVRVGVVSADGGPTTWVRLDGDAREHYLPRMEWAGPNEIVLQRMNRLQNRDDLLLADAATGASRPILAESDSAWVDVVDDFRWLGGGRELLWVSERDGWRHAYVVSRDGKRTRLVTPGAYDVVDVRGVDEARGWLYFIASPENATRRYLYRAPLRGGKAERLTPADAPATNSYVLSPDAQWAFHVASSLDAPPVTRLVSLPNHALVRTLVANERLRAAVAPLVARPAEFFRVSAGGTALDGWMLRPTRFDSTRTYPVLVYVYGEPAGQTTADRWSGAEGLWFRMLADLGYVIVSIDNHGTPAPRGRAWRKSVYGAVGVLASADQAGALGALLRERPYLDSSRVAVWGWSGGGSMTLNLMFRHPERYQVGMAVAPVPDQRLYDTIYQERYMGLPQQNAEGYRVGSPITFAEGLRGSLLVVHGSGDDNVHYQGTERLVNRLVALGKPFDFMAYPNRSHCICEGPGTTLHVYSLLTRYLVAHLPAGPR
jgi:dipeptidyl-peptidase 4